MKTWFLELLREHILRVATTPVVIKVYCNGDFRGSTAFIDARSGVGMVPLVLIEGLPGLRLNVRDNLAWFALNGRELTTTVGSNPRGLNW